MDWIQLKTKSPKEVTPVLVYFECCDICYRTVVAELEDGVWFISGTGEDLDFIPDYWAEISPPDKNNQQKTCTNEKE